MKRILAIALFASAATGMAQNNVDISVFGNQERVPLTPGKSEGVIPINPGWLEENKEFYLCAFGGPVNEEWTAYEFSFSPQKDGKVFLSLNGPFLSPEREAQGIAPICVAYDNLVVTGAEVENPDFEELQDESQLEGWSHKPDNLVINPGGAQSGNNYVKAAHTRSVSQNIHVKKGQEVTIHFQVKAVNAE
jgi:hypothetical protein